MARYALVKDGVVQNKIVAESDFIPKIESLFDYCVDLTSRDPEPEIGYTYDHDADTFSAPE